MNADTLRAVAECITRYLRANPNAADTVEGVHYVWVGDTALAASLDITQAALEYLLAHDRIACVQIGRRELWRLPVDGDR